MTKRQRKRLETLADNLLDERFTYAKLDKARKDLDLSKREMVNMIGVSLGTYRRWKDRKGLIPEASKNRLHTRICALLGVGLGGRSTSLKRALLPPEEKALLTPLPLIRSSQSTPPEITFRNSAHLFIPPPKRERPTDEERKALVRERHAPDEDSDFDHCLCSICVRRNNEAPP